MAIGAPPRRCQVALDPKTPFQYRCPGDSVGALEAAHEAGDRDSRRVLDQQVHVVVLAVHLDEASV